MNLGPQTTSSSREYQITLSGPDDASGQPTSLAGQFVGTETFLVRLWAGNDHLPAWTSTTALTWDATITGNPATLAQPVLVLSVPRSAVQLITPGRYFLQGWINPGVDDVEILPESTTLELTPAGGAAAPLAVYCALEDVRRVCGWIDRVLTKQTYVESDLGEQRARARSKLEDVIVAHYRPFSRRGLLGRGYQLGQPGTGSWGAGTWGGIYAGPSMWMRDQLAAGCLLLTGPRGDRAREITARWAVAYTCEALVGDSPLGTPYQQVARDYEAKANRLVNSYVAELDLNGDGAPDLWVPCGVSSAR